MVRQREGRQWAGNQGKRLISDVAPGFIERLDKQFAYLDDVRSERLPAGRRPSCSGATRGTRPTILKPSSPPRRRSSRAIPSLSPSGCATPFAACRRKASFCPRSPRFAPRASSKWFGMTRSTGARAIGAIPRKCSSRCQRRARRVAGGCALLADGVLGEIRGRDPRAVDFTPPRSPAEAEAAKRHFEARLAELGADYAARPPELGPGSGRPRGPNWTRRYDRRLRSGGMRSAASSPASISLRMASARLGMRRAKRKSSIRSTSSRRMGATTRSTVLTGRLCHHWPQ